VQGSASFADGLRPELQRDGADGVDERISAARDRESQQLFAVGA
jgi:hypothetical protein